MADAPTVAVIGNGAAGALVVTSVLREATRAGTALELAWIGDGRPAHGVAYATPHDWHRLNVPAAGMTLGEADEPFPDWLAARGLDDDAFAPRHAFGGYLAETLANARADAAPTVTVTEHRDRAVGCTAERGVLRVALRAGTAVRADHVVLALGPFPSAGLPAAPELTGHPRVVTDPWDGSVERITPGETVLLVGTGLTMVDVALTVARRAPDARMIATSRSGLLPRDHVREEGAPTGPAVRPRADLGLDELVAGVEDTAARHGGRWREVVDGLRPVTPELWSSLPRPEQRRFLAEQARRWETHRHRMAPSVAAELAALRAREELIVLGGGIDAVDVAGDDRLRVALAGDGRRVAVDRVVVCTGAQDDVTAVDDPLVASLLDGGLARPHPLGLGFDTGEHGALAPADGGTARLHGIGVLRRGELYETTAVPEIRDQAADLARLLVHGH